MSTRKFAKNTKAMTGMFKSISGASIKAQILSKFVGLLEAMGTALEWMSPIIDTLSALLEIGMSPNVIKLTKAMVEASQAIMVYKTDITGLITHMSGAGGEAERFGTALGDLDDELVLVEVSVEALEDAWDDFMVKIDDAVKILEGFAGIGASGGFEGNGNSGGFMDYLQNLADSGILGGGGTSDRNNNNSDDPIGDAIDEVLEYLTPGAAEGAIVRARAGGTRMTVAEGGEDEIIAPLSKLGADPEMLSYIRAGAEASMELLELKKRNRLKQKRIF